MKPPPYAQASQGVDCITVSPVRCPCTTRTLAPSMHAPLASTTKPHSQAVALGAGGGFGTIGAGGATGFPGTPGPSERESSEHADSDRVKAARTIAAFMSSPYRLRAN